MSRQLDHASRICLTAAQSLASSRRTTRRDEINPSLTDEQRDRMTASARATIAELSRDPKAEAARRAACASVAQWHAEHEERARRAEYLRAGLEPPTDERGLTMSLGLARSTGAVLRRIVGGQP